jgi:hypothetical protein
MDRSKPIFPGRTGTSAIPRPCRADQRERRRLVVQDENGFSLLPPVRATWAPRGHTPVLAHRFNWKRLSMAGALACRPGGSQAALLFQIKEGSCNSQSLIGFLEDLHEHFTGAPVTLIWDGLPAHRPTVMKAWITSQHGWLTVERLPGYAHDLNPAELVWGNVKAGELARPLRRYHRPGPRRRRGRPETNQRQPHPVFRLPGPYTAFSMNISH